MSSYESEAIDESAAWLGAKASLGSICYEARKECFWVARVEQLEIESSPSRHLIKGGYTHSCLSQYHRVKLNVR